MDHPVYTSFHLLLIRTHRTLSPYQQDSKQFIVFVRRPAIINTAQPSAMAQYSVIAVHKGLFHNASTTVHIKMFHIFQSLIYSLLIFTCPKSLAGYTT